MSSYQMELKDDVGPWELLRVDFSRNVRAHGDRIVRDALVALAQMQERGELRGGKLLKIDGPQSLVVAYALAHKLSHLYCAIAISDPKIGRPGYKTYIVAISHNPDYNVGDLVETAEPQLERNSIKVVLCGPPQSGKSCLREGLKWAIMDTIDAPYPYAIAACPDGEPAGIQEIIGRDSQLAKNIKQAYKSDLTSEYAEKTAKAIGSSNGLINIIDVGGKISLENELIAKQCNHAVILAGNYQNRPYQDHWAEWESFCKEVGLKVIAKIYSDYDGSVDRIDPNSPPLTGAIHHLTRGENVSDRPMIKALAELVIGLTYNSK